MGHNVTLIPGDGTGPGITAAAVRVLEATGVPFNWDAQQAGTEAMRTAGVPLPPSVLDSIRRNKVTLKGPVTRPAGAGLRSIIVTLREELDLYVCLRPCKSYRGVRSRYENVDVVVVREATEDVYAGIEFPKGDPRVAQIAAIVEESGRPVFRPDSGLGLKPISVTGSERIVRYAFEYARRNKRRKVTAVAKATMMKHTDGLFLEVARGVALQYPEIQYEERLVDAMCMELVQTPEHFDVLVMPNLYGDLLSDLCAGLTGGLGLAPGANIGVDCAVFDTTHGSAPKYAGMNKVNPMALMFSGVYMLRYLEERDAADRLEQALAAVIAEGRTVTYDMKADRNDPTAVGTSQVADGVIARLKAQ